MSESETAEPVVVHFDTPEALRGVLTQFEDVFAAEFGERVTTEDFYARYSRGEVDAPVATAWATLYEAYLELRDADTSGTLVPPLVAVA